MKFVYIINLILLIFLFGVTTPIYAQNVNPRVILNSSTHEENTPYTLTGNGCLPNSQASFWWSNTEGSGNRNTNAQGSATYININGWEAGTYPIRLVCLDAARTSSPPVDLKVVERCSYLEEFTYTANTPEPYTTATEFTFTGKITDCSISESRTAQITLGGIPDNLGNTLIREIVTTDPEGNFQVTGDLPEVTTYTIEVTSAAKGGKLDNHPTMTIVVGEEGSEEKLEIACNEGPFNSSFDLVDKDGNSRCEDGCEATFQPGGWYCGGGDTSCQLEEDIIASTDTACDETKKIVPPGTCGTDGILCGEGTFCIQEVDEEKEVMCETDFRLPSPTPPLPPCHTTRYTNQVFSQCYSVWTAVGIINTDAASIVKSLFGILLSISGGIALLLIIRSGYQMMVSRGEPEQIKEARERLTSAIIGLLFLIFSLLILEIIGVDILGLPGLGEQPANNSSSTQNSNTNNNTNSLWSGEIKRDFPTSSNNSGTQTPAISAEVLPRDGDSEINRGEQARVNIFFLPIGEHDYTISLPSGQSMQFTTHDGETCTLQRGGWTLPTTSTFCGTNGGDYHSLQISLDTSLFPAQTSNHILTVTGGALTSPLSIPVTIVD